MVKKSSTFPPYNSRRDPKDTSGYIYVFSLGRDNLYKVGKSVNWKNRLKMLQASNPKLECVLNVYVKDRHAAEVSVHQALGLHRVQREIFKLGDEYIDKIRDILMRFVE